MGEAIGINSVFIKRTGVYTNTTYILMYMRTPKVCMRVCMCSCSRYMWMNVGGLGRLGVANTDALSYYHLKLLLLSVTFYRSVLPDQSLIMLSVLVKSDFYSVAWQFFGTHPFPQPKKRKLFLFHWNGKWICVNLTKIKRNCIYVCLCVGGVKSLESEMCMCNKKGGVCIRCRSVCLCLRRICSHCSAVLAIVIVAVNDNNKFNVSLVGSVQHKSSAQTLSRTYCVCNTHVHIFACMCVYRPTFY